VYGANPDRAWTLLGETNGTGHVVIGIEAGDAAQYIRLRGKGTVSNLRVSIGYVPEPQILGIGLIGMALWARRPRRR